MVSSKKNSLGLDKIQDSYYKASNKKLSYADRVLVLSTCPKYANFAFYLAYSKISLESIVFQVSLFRLF